MTSPAARRRPGLIGLITGLVVGLTLGVFGSARRTRRREAARRGVADARAAARARTLEPLAVEAASVTPAPVRLPAPRPVAQLTPAVAAMVGRTLVAAGGGGIGSLPLGPPPADLLLVPSPRTPEVASPAAPVTVALPVAEPQLDPGAGLLETAGREPASSEPASTEPAAPEVPGAVVTAVPAAAPAAAPARAVRRRGPLRVAADRVLTAVLVVAAGIFLLLAAGPHVFGYRTAAVLSGSMAPALPVGAEVVVTSEPVTALRLGQVVMIHAPLPGTPVVSHRVVRIQNTADGVYIQTKGDANPVVDDWTARIIGSRVWVVRAAVPQLGRVVGLLQGSMPRLLVVGVLPGIGALVALRSLRKELARS